MKSQPLLTSRRFLPHLTTQFLNVFNDNILRNALVIFFTYTLVVTNSNFKPQALVNLSYAIFALPLFLFSAIAGQLADKYEKSFLIKRLKLLDIFIMTFTAIGFALKSELVLLIGLFLTGTQAALFGPVKFSILPDLLNTGELLRGNSYIEGTTFLAILIGGIIGNVVVALNHGPLFIAIIIVLCSIMGYLVSLMIPIAKIGSSLLAINFNIFKSTYEIIKYSYKNKPIFIAIIGISWFWFLGAMFLSQIPSLTKNVLFAHSTVVALFLFTVSLGIGIGSLVCNRLFKGKPVILYVAIASFIKAGFILDFYLTIRKFAALPSSDLIMARQFLDFPLAYRMLIDMFGAGLTGGIYIVPLFTFIQLTTSLSHRSRVMASNNVLNAFAIVLSAGVTTLINYLSKDLTLILLILVILNIFAGLYVLQLKKYST